VIPRYREISRPVTHGYTIQSWIYSSEFEGDNQTQRYPFPEIAIRKMVQPRFELPTSRVGGRRAVQVRHEDMLVAREIAKLK
jgi:hypothetical protein